MLEPVLSSHIRLFELRILSFTLTFTTFLCFSKVPTRFVALHAKTIRIIGSVASMFAKGAPLATVTVAVALVAQLFSVYFLFLFAFKTKKVFILL